MHLIESAKLRQRLLTFLLDHSEKDYYLRQLAGLVGADPGNLSRELTRLEKEGLLRSHRKGPLKLFRVDTRYPAYRELKRYFFKMAGVEGSLRNLVDGFSGIKTAFIHGSYARGTEKQSSDVDMVAVGDFSRKEFIEKVRALEARLDREINFTAYTEKEYASKRAERGGFLSRVVAGRVIPLKGSIRG